jgi:hypothetical protein
MPQVIIEGSSDTENARRTQKSLEKGHNRPLQEGAWVSRPEEYRVHLYSCAHKNLLAHHALLPHVEIPACEKGQRFRYIRYIPHPFPQKVEDVFNVGREPYDYHDGRRIAQDICNPSNPTLNQGLVDYGKIDPFYAVQDGTNYAKCGVFWSLNFPEPKEEEIAAAEKTRDSWYRALIAEHDKQYASKPANAANFGPDIRMALDYFGEERPYHKKFIPMQSCPNCATNIPQGVAFHYLPNGRICVLDWKRTVDAGQMRREEVPPGKRWQGFGRIAQEETQETA